MTPGCVREGCVGGVKVVVVVVVVVVKEEVD
jgi:hypothetical protein